MSAPSRILVIDVDGCLYPMSAGVFQLMRQRIREYFATLGLPPEGEEFEPFYSNLLHTHGSSFRGLVQTGRVEFSMQAALEYQHFYATGWDFSESGLPPNDVDLVSMFHRFNAAGFELWIFTNSVEQHAVRLMKYLGVLDFFPPKRRICFEHMNHPDETEVICKPSQIAFERASARISSLTSILSVPSQIVFVDDSRKNVLGAMKFGWKCVRVSEKVLETETQEEMQKAGIPVISRIHNLEDLVLSSADQESTDS